MTAIVAAAIISYLLGSIPFGLMLSRAAGYGDIREIGSGNIGATNVLRTGNKGLAALTLVLDFGKGLAAVAIASHWGEQTALAAALFAVIGHLFPVWLGFRGGKGAATALGMLVALCWPVAVIAVAIWLIVVFALRYSSLAALLGSAASGIIAPFLSDRATAIVITIVALLVILRHEANIRRLIAGREPRISFRKG
jgi:acyl phosphate:glycerol-3-phosphate acyltransferase